MQGPKRTIFPDPCGSQVENQGEEDHDPKNELRHQVFRRTQYDRNLMQVQGVGAVELEGREPEDIGEELGT